MKKIKENVLGLLGMAALTLTLMVFLIPEVQAQSCGSLKSVSTTCMQAGSTSWKCNNCDPGSTACSDLTCTQCKSDSLVQ